MSENVLPPGQGEVVELVKRLRWSGFAIDAEAADLLQAQQAEIERLREPKHCEKCGTNFAGAHCPHCLRTPALQEGHDQPCFFCGEPCDALAGNPGHWPVGFCHIGSSGVISWHHSSCLAKRLRTPSPTDGTGWQGIDNARRALAPFARLAAEFNPHAHDDSWCIGGRGATRIYLGDLRVAQSAIKALPSPPSVSSKSTCEENAHVDADCSRNGSAIAQERDEVEEMLIDAYKRGFNWCTDNGVNPEFLNKAACDYADATLTEHAQRKASDVSEPVNPNPSPSPAALRAQEKGGA